DCPKDARCFHGSPPVVDFLCWWPYSSISNHWPRGRRSQGLCVVAARTGGMSGGGAKGAMAVHGIPLRDLCAGLFIVGVGAYAVWEASAYPFGTLDSIGSGFFPVMLGLLALPLGAGVWWEAATRPAEPVSEDDGDAIEWRSIFAI